MSEERSDRSAFTNVIDWFGLCKVYCKCIASVIFNIYTSMKRYTSTCVINDRRHQSILITLSQFDCVHVPTLLMIISLIKYLSQ